MNGVGVDIEHHPAVVGSDRLPEILKGAGAGLMIEELPHPRIGFIGMNDGVGISIAGMHAEQARMCANVQDSSYGMLHRLDAVAIVKKDT